jgi:hypothetical protein
MISYRLVADAWWLACLSIEFLAFSRAPPTARTPQWYFSASGFVRNMAEIICTIHYTIWSHSVIHSSRELSGNALFVLSMRKELEWGGHPPRVYVGVSK